MDNHEFLRQIADREHCDGNCDLYPPYEKCPECEAKSALNENEKCSECESRSELNKIRERIASSVKIIQEKINKE